MPAPVTASALRSRHCGRGTAAGVPATSSKPYATPRRIDRRFSCASISGSRSHSATSRATPSSSSFILNRSVISHDNGS